MENCVYYARFMSRLPRPQAEGVYWFMFSFLLIVLFTASWKFGRTTERIEDIGARDRERVRLLRHCFWFCVGCGAVALVVVVLETFVIMALQFCDGEPLVSLYWATWTMLQVGGLIAIWGICLHIRHMTTGKRHPPWALALGTPVLVVAGLGHYFQGKLRRSRAARSIKERSRSRDRGRSPVALSEVYVDASPPTLARPGRAQHSTNVSRDRPTFRAYSSDSNRGDSDGPGRTICGDSSGEYNARIVGYTKNGDVIIRLAPNAREDFTSQVPLSSSITWDEPTRPASTLIEGSCSRKHSRTRGRSLSTTSWKGKERDVEAARDSRGEEVDIADAGDGGGERHTRRDET